MAAAETVALSATTVDENDNNFVTTYTWASDDTGVATVNASSGLVTAVANGTCTITATEASQSITDTCDITVTIPSSGSGAFAGGRLTPILAEL